MTTKATSSASGSFAKLMQSDQLSVTEQPKPTRPDDDVSVTQRTHGHPARANARPDARATDPTARTPRTNGHPVNTDVRTPAADDRTHGLMDQLPAAPGERKPERYSFQFWDDQIVRLKRLRQIKNLLRDPYERKEITMSDMVREAIDDYLDKETKQMQPHARPDA